MPLIIVEFEIEDIDNAMHVMENNVNTLERLTRDAQEHGARHHAFYASDQIVYAIDEWESEEAFHDFFDSNPEIQAIMAQAGARKQPSITILSPLNAAGTF